MATAVHPEPLLVAVGVIVAAAFFATLAFRAFKIPDIIFLIGLGVLLGPTLHFVDVGLFKAIAPFIGTVALIVILFEGGLKIRRRDIATGVASGALLALVVFVATALLCALVGILVAGLEPALGLLLGMSLGGAGVVIVIPLIRQLGVSTQAQTIVSIEAAVSDVLVILGVVGLSTALAFQQTAPTDFAVRLVQNFSIGLSAGAAAGWAWVLGLRAFKQRSYEYVLTVGILFLLYVATETVGGSGPLAVLSFGLVLGNSRKVKRLGEEAPTRSTRPKRTWEWAPVFTEELESLHNEVIFFLRAFFFVTLGVVIDLGAFGSPRFLWGGLLLAVGVVAGRYWSATLLFSRSRLEPWDRRAVSLMFPLGLAAAVVSLQPSQRFGIPGTEQFGSYAAVTIVLTNLAAALLVFFTARHASRHRKAATASPRPPAPSPPAWVRGR